MLVIRWRGSRGMELAPQVRGRVRRGRVPFVREWPSLGVLVLGCWFWGQAAAGVDLWTPIGPQGDQLMSVITDPATSTRLYAIDVVGEICRSNDAGATWTRVTPPRPPTAVCSATPVVQGDGTVYAGGCHVYKSTDGGVSWVTLGLSDADLTGDPTNPLVLYALPFNRSLQILFKTTDGGTTWAPMQTDLPVARIMQLVVDPTLPSRLYALDPDNAYKSTDGGVTWNPINTGLPSTFLYSLALSGSTLFVGTGGFGVYRTVDNGTSWTPSNNGISTQDIRIVRVGGGATPTLYATAANANGVPFFKSTDSGASWLLTGTLDTRVLDFVVSRQSDSALYAATLSGLVSSNNGGASWTFSVNNGLPNAAVSGLYADAVTPSFLYADSGSVSLAYKTTDGGSHWSRLTLPDGSPLEPIGVSPTHAGTVYGENCQTFLGCRIYRSVNFGSVWTPLLNAGGESVFSLLEAPNVPGLLFAIGGDHFLLRSDDDGMTWNEASSGLGPDLTAIAIDPSNSNVLYAGASNRVYKTITGGGVWVDASGGLPESNVNALAVSPAHPSTIFAGLGDAQSAPDVYGLYRSDDGGTTWGPRNPAFVNLAVTALAFDRSNPANVYAGTNGGGLYRSMDGGTSWRPINNGLTTAASLLVSVIAVDPVDGRNLYIGTDAGAFALTIEQYDSFVSVIEFYNYILDHYFIASELQADVPALDSGSFAGWMRTGQAFKARPQATGAAQPVCRFYIPPQHGDSHFYSASVAECAAVLAASTDPANPAYPNYSGYVYETPSSFYIDIPASGSCPPGELPVYRLWNGRFDSNHRYTTDPAIRNAMTAKGYVLEGVVMCALQ